MVDFGEVINSSAKWTINCLFRPFDFKKWMVLTFVALMAGYMSNGCNFNSGGGNRYENGKKETHAVEVVKPPAPTRQACSSPKLSGSQAAIAAGVIGAIVLVALILMIVLIWLSSRFSFIFLEDVVKNDASIKTPFVANRKEGNSLFKFNLLFTTLFVVVFGLIVVFCIMTFAKSGVFSKTAPDLKQILQFLAVFLPYLLVFLLVIIAAALIALIVNDFVITVMFREKMRFLQAWPKVMSLLKKNIGNLVLYILIKIGLSLGAGIVYLLLCLVCVLVLLIPGGLIGYVLYLVSKSVPAAIIGYWVVVGVVAAPICLFLLYCLIALYLPAAVFFRTFSVRFLGKLDPQYDLITPSPGA